MSVAPTQLRVTYKDKSYSGVYSVSGELVIARIPGINSKSAETTGDAGDCARQLLEKILAEADAAGTLR